MRRNSNLKFLRRLEGIPSITWILLGLLIIFSIIAHNFASLNNVYNLIRQGAVLTIVALAMMMTITSARTAPTIVQDKVRLSAMALSAPPVPMMAA